MINFFKSKRNKLVFSLICGLCYLFIITGFVIKYTAVRASGILLSAFFSPAVVCGAAVVIFKAITSYVDSEAVGQLKFLFFTHIAVIILGIVTLAGLFI